jgi:hypothetical protein
MDLLAALVLLLEAPRGPIYTLVLLFVGAPDYPVRHRTVHSNGSHRQFPSLEELAIGAPDRLLFTVMCTGHITIHYHVHQTVTIHYPVH